VSDEEGDWFYYVPPTLESLAQLLGDANHRVPLASFVDALYIGSTLLTEELNPSPELLQQDLQLTNYDFYTLFEPESDRSMPRGESHSVSLSRPRRKVQGSSEIKNAEGPVEESEVHASSEALAIEPLSHHEQRLQPLGSGLSEPVPFEERSPESIAVTAGRVADPVQRAELLARATQGHQRTLNALAQALRSAGFTLTEQPDGYDLYAWHPVRGSHLFEVKTWTDSNLAKQVRSGWAQLFEYRYRNAEQFKAVPNLYLVLSHKPPVEAWAWAWLVEDLQVLPCWMEADKLVSFESYSVHVRALNMIDGLISR
jgi:hypothetical protein